MGWSRRAGSEEAGDGAATARWRRRWQRGEGARQDATNEVETIWSVDNDNAQVSRVDLPSAASGVRQRWSRWNQENDAKVMWRRRYPVMEQATGQEQQRKQVETTQRHRRRNQRPSEKRGPKIDAERRRAAA